MLTAAVLAPTTSDQATLRTTAPRSDELSARLIVIVMIVVALAGISASRRRRDAVHTPQPSPHDSGRPLRRGPPLLAV